MRKVGIFAIIIGMEGIRKYFD